MLIGGCTGYGAGSSSSASEVACIRLTGASQVLAHRHPDIRLSGFRPHVDPEALSRSLCLQQVGYAGDIEL